MRVVFLGSPPFATPILKRLLEGSHQVLALVTPPDRPRGRGREVVRSPLVEVALERGIEVVQPTTTKDAAFVEQLAGFGADALAVASYGEILRTNVLELCPHGALNVHASILPRWRGASPIQRAIAAGDAETGVTIQRMVLALDAGPIAVTRRTPIGERETAADLFERLSILGADALVEALDRIEAGEAEFEPQDESRVTLAPKLRKSDGVLDFSENSAAVERHVRAMTTWPGARTTLPGGRDLVVLEARPVSPGSLGNEDVAASPGTLLDETTFTVRTGDGAVRLGRVKPAGKAAMDGEAFLRGARVARGDTLGT
ncbi:MAG: methionyl-tRNA formyltransferase [Planctomycetota bacterium]